MNQLLLLPNLKFIHAIFSLIFVMLLIHLPYMGIILGSSFFSTIYHRWKPAASKDLIDLVLDKFWAWIVFGFLPVIAIAFLYYKLLSAVHVPIYLYFLIILVIQVLGFIALSIYRRKDNHDAGVIGLLLITAYCYYFIIIIALTFFPERWYYLHYFNPILPYPLFNITPIIDFTNFVCLSLMITGAAILLFYFQWPGKHLSENNPHYIFLKRHGYGLILAGSLLMPLIIVWHLFNLPGCYMSISVYIWAVMELLFLAITAIAVIIILWTKNENFKRLQKYNGVFFFAAILAFFLWIGLDSNLQSNARQDIIMASDEKIMKIQKEIESKLEAKQYGTAAGSEQRGEQTYNKICSACHSFDHRIVGPPYNSVLPKYYNNLKQLEDFIRSPKKIDPGYPAMPNLGLNPVQIKSVIMFLMKKMGRKVEGEKTVPISGGGGGGQARGG